MESLGERKVLYDRNEIQTRVDELGEEISKDYRDKDLLVVSLLRGSFVFAADLVREINVPLEIDFMTTGSYGHGKVSSGKVEIIHELHTDIRDKDVLIVDDIIDSGRTLEVVKNLLLEKKPKSIKICTMLDKPSRRTVDISADYVGFSIDDLFIVGYGLNYENHYRNIPYIFTFDS